MSIKSKSMDPYQSGSNLKKWLQLTAQYLLSLPRHVKRAILLTADFAVAVICLFLALALRHGYIAHHVSPVSYTHLTLPTILRV